MYSLTWRTSKCSTSRHIVRFQHLFHGPSTGVVPAIVGTPENPTYEDAVRRLNSTQTGWKVLEQRRKSGVHLDYTGIEQMKQWVKWIGYSTSDFSRLNAIHVAGTKGKGTTCAFANSIMQRYQRSTGLPKGIGLYTSPHLVAVRERIRINSEPITEAQFTKYFFEVWRALESAATKEGIDPALKPSYFRFLTLMSFHVFMREEVDVAIYEVGVGGELDSTNVLEKPAVTGITTLGIDHVETLGDTIDKIAWHKAGIFKPGAPARTVEQVPPAMSVLEERAREKNVDLQLVQIHPGLQNVNLKPAEDFQRKNASLAIALVDTALNKIGVQSSLAEETLPAPVKDGLEKVVWRGRCETKITGLQHWHLDGAHTEDSLEVASSWFAHVSKSSVRPRLLIFNQQSTRDAISLLKGIHRTVYSNFKDHFDYAIFCTNVTFKSGQWKVDLANNNVDPDALESLSLQKAFAEAWKKLDPHTETLVLPTIQHAVEYVSNIHGGDEELQIFVTGSFHLIGGVLSNLEGEGFGLQSLTSE